METKNIYINELQEIAPVVAGIGKQNLYFVPEDYFNSLAESIFVHIRLAPLKSYNPFSVPEEYFENFADSVLTKIHDSRVKTEVYEELSEVAPLLNSIDKTNIFSVPNNYFQKLPGLIQPKKKQSKFVFFSSTSHNWVTYAASSSLFFIIKTKIYL